MCARNVDGNVDKSSLIFSLDCCKSSPLFFVLDWNFLSHFSLAFLHKTTWNSIFFPHKSVFHFDLFFCATHSFFRYVFVSLFSPRLSVDFHAKNVFHFTSSDFSLDSFAAETVLTSSRENARLNSVELKKKTWTSWGDLLSGGERAWKWAEADGCAERETVWLAMKLEGAWLCQRWLTASNLNFEPNGRLTRGKWYQLYLIRSWNWILIIIMIPLREIFFYLLWFLPRREKKRKIRKIEVVTRFDP